jgi:ABC-2 type transport system ATP-binding protein
MSDGEHTSNILELRNVSKRFATFSLREASFTLPGGFIMGMVGRNGAGKTTIIKSILNMIVPDGGQITVFGQDHLRDEREIKARIGVVMDYPFYVDDWTAVDVEKALVRFYPAWDAMRYRKLLARFAIAPKVKVRQLSHGTKIKLTTAVALSHGADLLILDEPTSGLDPVARDELMEALRDFVTDEGKGVLFSTHITSDLEKVADYLTFIDDGAISYSGAMPEFMERYLVVKGAPQTLGSELKGKIIGYREHSAGFDGLVERSLLPSLPSAVVAEPCTLEEIIIRLTGRSLA